MPLWALAGARDPLPAPVRRRTLAVVNRLINDGKIPNDLAVDFAMVTARSEVQAQKPEFSRRHVHPAIANAVDSIASGS